MVVHDFQQARPVGASPTTTCRLTWLYTCGDGWGDTNYKYIMQTDAQQ